MLPDQDIAVALLTNGGNTRDLYGDLYREIFAEVADVEMPSRSHPPAEPVEVDIAPYVGTYARSSVRMEVFVGDEGPMLRTTILGPLAEMIPDPVDEHPLVPVGPALFAVKPRRWTPGRR